jgi:hypothetical protein
MGNEFMYQANALADAIKIELLTQLNLADGQYPDSASTSKSFQVQNSAANGGGPWFDGITNFRQELGKFEWGGTPLIVHDYGAFDRMVRIGGTQFCCSELGVNFTEHFSGFRAYSNKVLKTVPFQRMSNDFVFDQEMMASAISFESRTTANSAAKGSLRTTEAITNGPAQAPRPASSTLRKWCGCPAERIALIAIPTSPLVAFLNPTGIDNPLASSRCDWLSVVLAPIADQLTKSARY